MEGHFSVQLAGGSPFRRILVDQTMDVTFNKDTKIAGIVTRLSLKTGAVNRFHHDEMQSPRMPKDEEQVLVVEALTETWNNPFVGNQDLNSISTAKDAPVDTSYDLLHACGI